MLKFSWRTSRALVARAVCKPIGSKDAFGCGREWLTVVILRQRHHRRHSRMYLAASRFRCDFDVATLIYRVQQCWCSSSSKKNYDKHGKSNKCTKDCAGGGLIQKCGGM